MKALGSVLARRRLCLLYVFSNLRVCAYEAFSQQLGRCVRDQRRTVLVSSRFVCSVSVSARARRDVQSQWTYDGAKLPPFSNSVRKGVRRRWIRFDVGAGFALPGGRYSCEFASGRTRTKATFVSGGPTGEIVTAVVCDSENAFDYDNFPVCRTDEAGTVIESPSAVVCLAVYPNVSGRKATITLLREGERIESRVGTVAGPMTQRFARFQSPGRATVRPGKYVCSFLLDDRIVVERPFEVADTVP